jgi:hypothetical protein
MPIIFDVLYREFCRARLAEMRKQLLLWPGTPVEANCKAGHPDDAADITAGSSQEPDSHAERSHSEIRKVQSNIGSFRPACHLLNVLSTSELGQIQKN